jgi:DNA-directed RNA polymerase specialized sigma24 family protein
MAARLPERVARAMLVPIDGGHDLPAEEVSAEERVAAGESAVSASRTVRETLRTMTAEDRIVLRMRFDEGARVVDMARMLGCDQKQLYRRIDALIRKLRDALLRAGIDAVTAHAMLAADAPQLHFGLAGDEKESTS